MAKEELNQFEQSAVLYYADYMSMRETSHPVSDTCKYFYVFGYPLNSSFMEDSEPFYNVDDQYYKDALSQYLMIKRKFGELGVCSFLNNICNLQAAGTVNGEQMLAYIHRHSTKRERANAFDIYNQYKTNQKYTHVVAGENGPEVQECSKYVAHAEIKRLRKRPRIPKGSGIDGTGIEIHTKTQNI